MILCLDDFYQKTPIINRQTIFSYEAFIRHEFEDTNIVVRLAANCINEKSLAIRFSLDCNWVFERVRAKLINEPGFEFRGVYGLAGIESGHEFMCVFAPLNKMALLHQELSACIKIKRVHHQSIEMIADRIFALMKFNLFLVRLLIKEEALKDLWSRIRNAKLGSTPSELVQIVEKWENEKLAQSDDAVNNKAILALRRNRLFSEKCVDKPTDTTVWLEDFKTGLADVEQAINPSSSVHSINQ